MTRWRGACRATTAMLLALLASDVWAAQGGDRLAELLRDLAGLYEAPEAVADYRRLVSDPKAALKTLDDWGDADTITGDQLRQRIFLHICAVHRLLVFVDWAAGYVPTLDQFNARMAPFIGAMPPDQKAAILAYIASKTPIQRGSGMGWLFGPLAAHAEAHGLAIVNLYDASDTYAFAILPKALRDRWIGTKFSKSFEVEDPSWQFETQLAGSPYQYLLRK